jgi:hypothetical protein
LTSFSIAARFLIISFFRSSSSLDKSPLLQGRAILVLRLSRFLGLDLDPDLDLVLDLNLDLDLDLETLLPGLEPESEPESDSDFDLLDFELDFERLDLDVDLGLFFEQEEQEPELGLELPLWRLFSPFLLLFLYLFWLLVASELCSPLDLLLNLLAALLFFFSILLGGRGRLGIGVLLVSFSWGFSFLKISCALLSNSLDVGAS